MGVANSSGISNRQKSNPVRRMACVSRDLGHFTSCWSGHGGEGLSTLSVHDAEDVVDAVVPTQRLGVLVVPVLQFESPQKELCLQNTVLVVLTQQGRVRAVEVVALAGSQLFRTSLKEE